MVLWLLFSKVEDKSVFALFDQYPFSSFESFDVNRTSFDYHYMQSQTSEEVHRQGDFLRIPQIGSSSAIAYLVVNCVIPGRSIMSYQTKV